MEYIAPIKKVATVNYVAETLNAVVVAEVDLKNSKILLKQKEDALENARIAYDKAIIELEEAREDVKSKASELKHRQRVSNRAYKSALKNKPI